MVFYANKRLVAEGDKPSQCRILSEIGDVPSSPGIYDCQTCKYEDVVNRECIRLPPCSNCKKKDIETNGIYW
jgi:hypothetical protein